MERTQEKKFVCKFCNKRIIKGVAEAEADGQSAAAYGLREPQETKKFSDSGNAPLLKEMICKECSKRFHSLKALCGHMACHSEKERIFVKKQKMIEQEQEEVAMCLMMLSRDSAGCCKKGLNSITDSSDNNSVILEAKSSSIDGRITIKNDMKCVPNNGDYLRMKKQRDNKLKYSESGSSSESSDSSYFRYGPKKEEFEDFYSKLGKSLSMFKSLNNEFPKDNNQANRGMNKALGGHRATHTKANDCSEDSLASDGFIVPMTDTKVTNSSPHGRTLNTSSGNAEKRLLSKKNKGHQCPFCFRVFNSGQALGGHKISHFVGAPVEDDATGNVGFSPWKI
ncbi:hypothetical protein F3Y22_tig00111277pilonHSYRG00007 [Hibiscus syriacus]|uniref:C2H2-type domain-containing protein n=1 Tax=Hibiscus syriacus TaxID=106335 RepID=A0A6A2YRK4_HIBSY|nr:hypothetical protein F3Y22_tig00111277pilonHSYRG00007 [Hibiscus syriacus]